MGLIECMSSGVPMILFPHTAEQTYNSFTLAESEVAWILDEERFSEQIEFLLNNRAKLRADVNDFYSRATFPGGAEYTVRAFEYPSLTSRECSRNVLCKDVSDQW